MLENSCAFSGFSVRDLKTAKIFYGKTLGLKLETIPEGLSLKLGGGQTVFIYPKDDHQPATFTVLYFPVDDLNVAVDKLTAAGINFEQYDFGFAKTDHKGVLRGKAAGHGPDIAWFKDPAGNTLAVLEN